MARRPHLLVISYPSQGHIMPLMELSHSLVDCGFKITFVNSEFTHKRVMAAAVSNNAGYEGFLKLVSIPDGMEEGEDRNQHAKLVESIEKVMPGHLEELIRKINEGDDRITCVIADDHVGWALEVAAKMSIPKAAAFWPASATLLALKLHIPKLIEDGIITADGDVIKRQMIQLSPTMPAMDTTHLAWLCFGDPGLQKAVFKWWVRGNSRTKLAGYLICNSFLELEPSAFELIPNVKPIGPLLASSQLAHLWPEDSTCLRWLHQHPNNSVVYVAFGSTTIMDKTQFHELALGLELSGHPFLWVVRPDLTQEATDAYPEGFEARVGSRGRMVAWAPQGEVLAHPAVGGFVTHCGWNSTMEGLCRGVPLLCWPYFADQIQNKTYICHVWKNGLGFKADANGIISREEIKAKVVRLLGDERIKASAVKLKEAAVKNVSIGGESLNNFEDFVQGIKSTKNSF